LMPHSATGAVASDRSGRRRQPVGQPIHRWRGYSATDSQSDAPDSKTRVTGKSACRQKCGCPPRTRRRSIHVSRNLSRAPESARPGQLHHRLGNRPRPAHRRRRSLPRRPADLTGAIGRAVLATLLPARRARYCPHGQMRHLPLPQPRRRPAPHHHHHHQNPRHHLHPATTQPGQQPPPHRRTRTSPQPPTHRQLITAIITSQPPRPWHGTELAARLNAPPRYLLSQLAEWARAGLFTRTGPCTYILNTPPAPASSTTAPDP
jgi:hypothetical protein